MTRSSTFVGAITLVAVLLLIVYGISALEPTLDETDINAPSAPPPSSEPTIDYGNPSRGPVNARITLVVFGNYECAACASYNATLHEILNEFPQDVRLVWKDLSGVTRFPQSRDAAVAARCARAQGAFWEYHNVLMNNQTSLAESNYRVFAQELGLDTNAFETCYSERQTEALVKRDLDEAISLGVDATPFTFINEQRISGSMNHDRLRSRVQSILTAVPTP